MNNILKIIDSLINNRWLVINGTHYLFLYPFAYISYHTRLISLSLDQRFQCKTLQNKLTSWQTLSCCPFPFPPSCPSLSLSPKASLCLLKRYVVSVVVRVPLSIGVSYTGQQFKCRSQPHALCQCLALLWLAHCTDCNRFTSASRCLIPALFDPLACYQTHFVSHAGNIGTYRGNPMHYCLSVGHVCLWW